MPALKDHRKEKYAQELAKGKTQVEAYKASGFRAVKPDCVTVVANRMAHKPDVEARIAELKEVSAMRAEVTVASLIQEAEEARQLAMATDNPSAAVMAIREKGVLSGKRIQRSEIGMPGEFDHLSDDELFRLLQDEAAEVARLIDQGGNVVDGPDTEQ